MTIDDLTETFSLLTDWEDRYRLRIDLGRKLPGVTEDEMIDSNRVEGCTSKVWLIPESNGGTPPVLEFRADSDSFIVKGLLAIILMTYSGKTPEQILATDVDAIFTRLGLEQNLSPNRRSGFYATVERIKDFARAAQIR